MKKLYCVRLYQIYGPYYLDHNKCEVMNVGNIIVSKKKKYCRECFYNVDIPIVSSPFNPEDDGKNELIFIPNEDRKVGYFVLKSDLSEENIVTKKDILKLNFESYADMSMKIIQLNNELDKEIEKDNKGVVYGKIIRRGQK